MTETLAAAAVQFCIFLGGLGVLRLTGARPRSTGHGFALAGLAYMLGVACVYGLVELLLFIGIPFGIPTVLIVSLAFAVPALITLPRLLPAVRIGRPSRATAYPIVGGIALLVAWLYILPALTKSPLTYWDAWTIWTYKARIFHEQSHIPVELFQAVDRLHILDRSPTALYPLSHFDYPLTLPLWEATQFRALGSPDTSTVTGLLWLLLPAWAGAMIALAPRNASKAVVLPTVAGIGLLLTPYIATDLADVPLAMFLSVGMLAAGRWLQHRDRQDLIIAVILLGGAAGLKNEGIVGGGVIFASLVICLLRDRPALKSAVVAGVLWAVAFVLPWKLWLLLNDVHGDLATSKMLNPSYLIDEIGRLKEVWITAWDTFGDQNITVVVLLAILVLAVTRGPAPRIRAFAVLTFGLYTFALIAVYWTTPHELQWHLVNSMSRVLLVLALLGVAGMLLITERPAPAAPDESGPAADAGSKPVDPAAAPPPDANAQPVVAA